MKNKIIVYLGLSLAIVMQSCDDFLLGNKFLEKPLATEMNLDSIFSRKAYADQVLAEAYRQLPDYLPRRDVLSWAVLETQTDLGDCNKPGGTEYYKGSVTASSSFNHFPYHLEVYGTETGRFLIGAIRQSYIYIENVDRVPDMTPDEKRIRKAEAKALIAYQYSQWFRFMGGVVWIDHAYKPTDDFSSFTRSTVAESVEKICALCDEAAADLPWSTTAAEDGRMTAAAMKALKVRVLLFAASPLFNSTDPFLAGEASSKLLTWYGDYSAQRWQDVIDAGLEFLNLNSQNGDYWQLNQTGNPREDYVAGYFNRYNNETLISSRQYPTYKTNIWAFSQIRYGTASPTGNYADMFQMADGSEFSWSKVEDMSRPYFNADGTPTRDIRFYETLAVLGDKYQGRTFEPWEPTGRECETQGGSKMSFNGFAMRKFRRDYSTEMVGKFYSCPLLRLPEIYLSIAEAMNELGQAKVRDRFGRNAYDYVDLVRDRVGMPSISHIAEGEPLREAILNERAFEFGYEECRFFDINRWKRIDILQKPLYRYYITKNSDGTFNFEKKDLLEVRKYVLPELWSPKYYLVPYTLDEVNKRYGLIQNPGW